MSRRYEVFDPNSKVLGKAALAMSKCIQSDAIYPYLQRYHLTDIDPDHWYPLQTLLEVLNAIIASSEDAMFNLVSIGLALVEARAYPAEWHSWSFEDIVLTADAAHQAIHQGDVGGHQVEIIEPQHAVIKTRTPYPDDLIYGTFYGIAREFLPPPVQFAVYYDDTLERRDFGGDYTMIHIVWK